MELSRVDRVQHLPSLDDLMMALRKRHDPRYQGTMMASCELLYCRPNGRSCVWKLWLFVNSFEWVDAETVRVVALANWPDDPDMATDTMATHKIELVWDIVHQRMPPRAQFKILD